MTSFLEKYMPKFHAAFLTPTAPQFEWPALDDYDFQIVGVMNYQAALKNAAGEHGDKSAERKVKAIMIPEETNPHDNKAVRVEIGGALVGYMSRDDARSFRNRLSRQKIGIVPTQCDAIIVGGFLDKKGKHMSYGVRLDIKPFG